jgi:hypothetical protein
VASDKVIGLAALGSTTEEISHFDYQAMSPGLYALVFGPVTVFVASTGGWIDVSVGVTDHEDTPAPVDGEDAISCSVARFRKRKEVLDGNAQYVEEDV